MEIAVPEPDASFDELSYFALRYDGYGIHGDRRLADIHERVEMQWQGGTLPTSLDELRAALFLLQRTAHWNGNFNEEFARALIEQIRAISGGTVDGSPDITV